jgi:hypothetical protein
MVLARQTSTSTIAWVDFAERGPNPMGGVIGFCACRATPLHGGRQRGTGSSVTTSARHLPRAAARRRSAHRSPRRAREPTPVGSRTALRRSPGSTVARTSLARGPNDTRRATPALVGTRSTPPRRSPLRRRSNRHSGSLSRFGGGNARAVTEEARGDRWPRSARPPGALPLGSASAAPRGGDVAPRGFGHGATSLRIDSRADPGS